MTQPAGSSPALADIFPVSSRMAGTRLNTAEPAEFPHALAADPQIRAEAPYLPELAGLEKAAYLLESAAIDFPHPVSARTLNPTVQLLEVPWSGLPEFLGDQSILPQHREALVLLYRPGPGAPVRVVTPDGHDLLALKLVSEAIDSGRAATEAGVTVGRIDAILAQATHKGLLLAPPSSLVRTPDYLQGRFADPEQSRAATFALQWHLTQACDLNCRHCYDRSARKSMDFAQAVHVLDQLYASTQTYHGHAQVSFSGGNPMLSPYFYEIYREAVDRGFLVAVLGNPMDRPAIERMVAIRQPEFFQVSLEGLRSHNDFIRGPGHYDRVLAFLELLRELGVYSMVMLTLTRANSVQVLALAEELRGRADLFTFNRLAMVGQGADLASLEPERFPAFLDQFLAAAHNQPHLSLKDNLFNLRLAARHRPLTGGCAGFGCGAAFNFVAVLPDGEVHACRKFPSPLGNIFTQPLVAIYEGETAARYRAGSSACLDCELRPVCRGCPAVAHGFGLDVFTALDPYCWKKPR